MVVTPSLPARWAVPRVLARPMVAIAAYYGHVDPGNHKWNLGSFSYQHGAKSPAEADAKQLKRLYKQALTLRQQASQCQVNLSLAEELNGIDLANQAPLAANELR